MNNIPLVYKTIEYEKRTHTIARELLSLVTFREEDILSILEKFEYILYTIRLFLIVFYQQLKDFQI